MWVMSTTDIVANIDQRLDDLDAELTHLSKARTALVSEPTATAQSKPRRARRAPVKRTFDVVPSGKLIALLADSDGMRTRELSDTTNADPSQVLTLLKEHEAMGQVRRTGTRAATRWHAITDEDRIPARAAELEGASSRRSRARKN
jgi:hypothetical protein